MYLQESMLVRNSAREHILVKVIVEIRTENVYFGNTITEHVLIETLP